MDTSRSYRLFITDFGRSAVIYYRNRTQLVGYPYSEPISSRARSTVTGEKDSARRVFRKLIGASVSFTTGPRNTMMHLIPITTGRGER